MKYITPIDLAKPTASASANPSADGLAQLAEAEVGNMSVVNVETVVSHYPKHKDPKKITAHQHDLNDKFRQAVSQAKIELTTPDRRAYWQEQFNNQPTDQKQYKTLRGFVIAQLTKQQ